MASLAEMMLQQGLQNSTSVPDYAGSITRGAELGLHVQQVEQQRQQLEAQKAEARQKKIQEVTDDLLKAKNMGGKQLEGYKTFLNNKALTYKVDDIFDKGTIDMVTSTPENLERFSVLKDDVLNGRRTYAEALQVAKDPSAFIDVTPNMLGDLYDASKTRVSANEAKGRAYIIQAGQDQRQTKEISSAGSKKTDQDLATEYVDFYGKGGKASVDSALAKLDGVSSTLDSGKVTTGKLSNFIPGFSNDTAQTMLNPQVQALKVDAQSALNTVLKTTLGAQFTEREGERVLNQIWDGKQSPKENARRIKNKVAELRSGVNSKIDLFRSRGFDTNIGGELGGRGSGSKFTPVQIEAFKKVPKDKQSGVLQKAADALGMTLEEAKAQLGVK